MQSLSELTQDPSDRTNELLANLTDIILALGDSSLQDLNIAPRIPFTPERSAVRLNLYWSIALIASVRRISASCQMRF